MYQETALCAVSFITPRFVILPMTMEPRSAMLMPVKSHGEENGYQRKSIDQAALHGLLKEVRDLSMPLVSVSPVEPGQAEASEVKSPGPIE
jgi:hypothetical protein